MPHINLGSLISYLTKLEIERVIRSDDDDDEGEYQRVGEWRRRPDGTLPVDGSVELACMVQIEMKHIHSKPLIS